MVKLIAKGCTMMPFVRMLQRLWSWNIAIKALSEGVTIMVNN